MPAEVRKERALTVNKRKRIKEHFSSPSISALDIVLPPFRMDT
jgi:hypothetical protein